jgi:hypothetical protein
MSKLIINIGDSVNDKRGDPLRTAFDKVNQNFTELYNQAGIVVQTSAPASPGEGDLWYDPNDGRLFVYYDSTWVDASPIDGTGIPTTAAPAHSYGSAGDEAGMVAFDNAYIYYCTANYVNNSTNIWKRVALNATPW